MILLVALMILFMILGVRIFYAIALSSIIYVLLATDMSLLVIVQRITSGADTIVMLAVPFFLLAGELMNKGGITDRLVRFALAMIGQVRGGMSFVVVVVNMIMAAVSGAAIASGAAVGSVMIPNMEKQGYSKGFAGAINAAAATIGPVIPPSVGFIIYASVSNASVGKLFIAGTIPGIIAGIVLMIIGYYFAVKRNYPAGEKRSTREMWISLKKASWSLLMPVIILGGIISGIVTPTEAGVIAVVYGLFVGMVIHKEIKWRDVPDMLSNTAKSTAQIMVIIAGAAAFGWLITREVEPAQFIAAFTNLTGSRTVLLLVLLLFILLLGTVMEGGSIMIILTPLLLPVLTTYNIDIIHFGVVFQLAIMIGLLTPPVGMLLFVIVGAGKVSLNEILKNIWPFYIGLFCVMLLVTFVPDIALWLVDLLGENIK
jgi:C4-dicarboxylate transporter, DctM subunit